MIETEGVGSGIRLCIYGWMGGWMDGLARFHRLASCGIDGTGTYYKDLPVSK